MTCYFKLSVFVFHNDFKLPCRYIIGDAGQFIIRYSLLDFKDIFSCLGEFDLIEDVCRIACAYRHRDAGGQFIITVQAGTRQLRIFECVSDGILTLQLHRELEGLLFHRRMTRYVLLYGRLILCRLRHIRIRKCCANRISNKFKVLDAVANIGRSIDFSFIFCFFNLKLLIFIRNGHRQRPLNRIIRISRIGSSCFINIERIGSGFGKEYDTIKRYRSAGVSNRYLAVSRQCRAFRIVLICAECECKDLLILLRTLVSSDLLCHKRQVISIRRIILVRKLCCRSVSCRIIPSLCVQILRFLDSKITAIIFYRNEYFPQCIIILPHVMIIICRRYFCNMEDICSGFTERDCTEVLDRFCSSFLSIDCHFCRVSQHITSRIGALTIRCNQTELILFCLRINKRFAVKQLFHFQYLCCWSRYILVDKGRRTSNRLIV